MNESDFMKNLEQARALSKLFGGAEEKVENDGKVETTEKAEKEGEDSFVKMAQMMELMQLFQGFSTGDEKNNFSKASESHNAEAAFRFYDDDILTTEMRIAKAAIPYLPHPQQKKAGILLKAIEMQKLLQLYSAQAVQVHTASRGGNWRLGMLMDIRPHMPREKQDMIDMIVKFMEIKDIMAKVNQINNNSLHNQQNQHNQQDQQNPHNQHNQHNQYNPHNQKGGLGI